MKSVLDRILTLGLLGVAVGLTAWVAWVRLGPGRPTSQPEWLEGWASLMARSERLGPEDAQVRVIAFLDPLCPPCRRAVGVILERLDSYPGELVIYVQHTPYEAFHPGSTRLSIGAICADREGFFPEYFRFLHGPSLGNEVPTPESVGEEVPGLIGNSSYRACLADPTLLDEIDGDRERAEELGIDLSPVFIVEGRMVYGAPTPRQLDRLLREAKQQIRTSLELGRDH